MEQETSKKQKKGFLRYMLGVFAILMVLTLTVAGCTSNAPANTQDQSIQEQENTDSQPVDTQETPVQETEVIAADKKSETEKTQETLEQAIADGTYENVVEYAYHSGTEDVTVKITVANDVVTEATVTAVGDANKVSLKYINGVNAALPDLVVGKKITELNLPTQISGSSLTVAAFKQQVDALIEQN